MLRVQHRVEEEERAALCKASHTFHLVFVNRVAHRLAEARMGIQHEAVILAHGFHRGAARKNGLASSAVTREIVIDNRAGQNDMIHVTDILIDQHRRAAGGLTKIEEVLIHMAVRIDHLHAGSDFRPHGFNHFVMRHIAVSAEREHDLHVFVRNTKSVHFIKEHRHEVVRIRNAREVVADEGDRLPRLHDFIQRRASDRMADGFKHPAFDIRHRSEILSTDLLQDERVIQRELLAATPIGEVIATNCHLNLNFLQKERKTASKCSVQKRCFRSGLSGEMHPGRKIGLLRGSGRIRCRFVRALETPLARPDSGFNA